jgi:hypothetical protein
MSRWRRSPAPPGVEEEEAAVAELVPVELQPRWLRLVPVAL